MSDLDVDALRAAVSSIPDPEIPVITIEELGILRDVSLEDGRVVVTIIPTYSGCPAMELIREQVAERLAAAGVADPDVRLVHSPAWTTEWISPEARSKLERYGIAPPGQDPILCPRCRASEVRTVSRFGSTACKALMVCSSCGEPFDHFKDF